MPWTCFQGRMGVKNTLKIHSKHPDELLEPCGVRSVDVKGGKEISLKSLILSHSPDLTSRSITETYHSMGTYQPHRFRDDFDTFHIV